MPFRLTGKLPLFRRELTELAQRRRTYIIRVLGAVILLAWVMFRISALTATGNLMIQAQLVGGTGTNPFAAPGMGIGGDVFDEMVPLMFLLIPALLPALCCSAITAEKEQNTFGTLLLTRLSPTTILFEKLLSRIVPMLTLLLLVSPVLAYVYSLGGLDSGMLFGGFWLLFCECLLFASLSLFFSAWFPSTVSAFVWSYLFAGLLVAFGNIFPVTAYGVWNAVLGLTAIMTPTGAAPASGMRLFVVLLQGSLIPIIMSLVLLTATRIVLVRRAFVSHSSMLIRLFQRLDTFFKDLNAWTTGGIELVAESSTLPDDDPVTWRERNKKSLGQFRWLVRVLVVLEFPTMFICSLTAAFGRSASGPLTPLLFLLWIFAAVLAAVKGASLFAQERSRQTLEPLLSTTLTTRELVEQKVTGTNRLLIVLACPIMTVYLTQAYMVWRGDLLFLAMFLLLSTSLMFIILRTIVWISTAVGIRVRSQPRAIAASITVIALFAVITMAPSELLLHAAWYVDRELIPVGHLLYGLGAPGAITAVQVSFLSLDNLPPFSYATARDSGALEAAVPTAAVLIPAMLFQAGWLLIARWLVLRIAPVLLQRLDHSPPAARPVSVRPVYG